MRALVVYESMYGNTAAVGEVVAASLRSQGLDADARAVTGVESAAAEGVDLLVVGGPTHVHGMSRAATRRTAASDERNDYPDPTVEPGLREWIAGLPPGSGRPAAAFDTRIDKPTILTGSAARGIGRRLQGRGFELVVGPESFLVSAENSLLDGEVDRAATWATELDSRTSLTAR